MQFLFSRKTLKEVHAVCLYPWRFHRISADNDLHISETELLACHHAMLAYGLHTETPEECLEQEDEITYQDEKKRLYIEVYRSLFDTSDEAPDDLNIFFKDAVKNAVEMDGFLAMPPYEHFRHIRERSVMRKVIRIRFYIC